MGTVKNIIEDPKVRIIGKAALGVGELFGPGWLAALSKQGSKLFNNNDVNKNISEVLQNIPKINKQLNESFRLILDAYPANSSGKKPDKLVIFIDDLDRCEAQYIVKILESLKLHLLNDYCVFVMGIATDKIKDALITQKVAPDLKTAKTYLEKIIQLPIQLPYIWDRTLETYIKDISGSLLPDENNEHFKTCFELLKTFSSSNPRSLKQFFAWYALHISMINMIPGLDDASKSGKIINNHCLLLKIKLLQFDKPDTYELPSDFLADVSEVPTDKDNPDKTAPASMATDKSPYEKLAPFVGDWLKEDPKHMDQLQLFLALTTDETIAGRQNDQLQLIRDVKLAMLNEFDGRWTGYYVDDGKRSKMDLQIKVAENGTFTGKTTEKTDLGEAIITGKIDLESKTITFTKRYTKEDLDYYEVTYNGIWSNTDKIEGQWMLFDDSGEYDRSDDFQLVKNGLRKKTK